MDHLNDQTGFTTVIKPENEGTVSQMRSIMKEVTSRLDAVKRRTKDRKLNQTKSPPCGRGAQRTRRCPQSELPWKRHKERSRGNDRCRDGRVTFFRTQETHELTDAKAKHTSTIHTEETTALWSPGPAGPRGPPTAQASEGIACTENVHLYVYTPICIYIIYLHIYAFIYLYINILIYIYSIYLFVC